MNQNIIGHIDADCFYVSCERVRDPRLIGKPVGVLGNQGACVIARSYEMRPTGVKVGMPIWQCRKLCPDGIYIKRDFHWYEILSKQMQDILHDFSDTVEYYSVDESFVDFGQFPEEESAEITYSKMQKLALQIQQRILKEVKVPVSVGISITRTLAKMASEKNKPFGTQIVDKDHLQEFLANCSPDEIAGIGRKLIKRIPHLKTTLDYINEPRENIKKLLHKPGEEFWYELQGISLLKIKSVRPERKVLSRGGSIWGWYKDPGYIWGFLVRNLERLALQLSKEELEICDLTLILITSEGPTLKATFNFPDYTNNYFLLLSTLKKAYTYGYVHIIATNLRSTAHKQLNLFPEENLQQQKLLKLKYDLNQKYGNFTIRSGATAYVPAVFADETSNYEICDIDGKICF